MAALPEPWKSLRAELEKVQEQIRALYNRSPFFGTGVHPNGNLGLDSDNFVAGTSGFSLNGGTGNAEFNDIVLRDLPNSMLASPIVPAVGHGDGVNFPVTTTATDRAIVTIPVPAGYTRAMVTATASLSAYNPTLSGDYIYVSAHIAGDVTLGYSMPQGVSPDDSSQTSQTATALLTGLSGSFDVKASVKTAFAAFSTATTGNVCNIDATVLFLR